MAIHKSKQMLKPWDAVAGTVQFGAPVNLAAFHEFVAPEAQVLDLGCGYGRIAHELSLAGFTRVRGYDVSERMIERAKVEHPNLQLGVADAAALPEPDHSFDAVVVAALLTSVPARLRQRAIAGEVSSIEAGRDGSWR